jgi:hypothetical protein
MNNEEFSKMTIFENLHRSFNHTNNKISHQMSKHDKNALFWLLRALKRMKIPRRLDFEGTFYLFYLRYYIKSI